MSITLLAFFFSTNLVQTMHLCSQRQTDRSTHRYVEHPVGNLFHMLSLFLSFFSAVRFHDCGQGGRVHFECSQPTAFRIEITGEVLALRTLQPSLTSSSSFLSSPLLVIARDISTQEQWQTEVRLRPSGGQGLQV